LKARLTKVMQRLEKVEQALDDAALALEAIDVDAGED
jgi:hypothetical protein